MRNGLQFGGGVYFENKDISIHKEGESILLLNEGKKRVVMGGGLTLKKVDVSTLNDSNSTLNPILHDSKEGRWCDMTCRFHINHE